MAGYSAPAENLGLLERLIRTRADMAAELGAPSYAHYTLRDATLAGSPEAVQSFLLDLAAAIRPKVGTAAAISNFPWRSIPGLALKSRCGGQMPVCNWLHSSPALKLACTVPDNAACMLEHDLRGERVVTVGAGDRAAALAQGPPPRQGRGQRAPGGLGPALLHRARQSEGPNLATAGIV